MTRDIALGNPAERPEEDAFNRMPFCVALANRIANLNNDEGAAVIGLYGKWGYGKSTVLNFVKHHLEQNYAERVSVISFNPWLFTEQKDLLLVFFKILEEARNSKKTGVKIAADLATRFSGIFGMVPIVGNGLAKLIEQIGGEAKPSLQDRQAAQKEVSENDTTIVILIDDVDRLDRQEVMLILKLVRLNSNLPRLVYLLAFDDEIISVVAGSAYGDTPSAGREFLEKIVQFPFVIPALGQERLSAYVMELARKACEQAAIELDVTDWSAFSGVVKSEFSLRLRTPRQAIRYAAALEFALPMLRGEVNPVHQMVIEGIRILYPEVYGFIRDNIRLMTDSSLFSERDEKIDERLQETRSDKNAAKALVEFFFTQHRENSHIPRALSDTRYFYRYFEYSVRPSDILESEIENILQLLSEDASCSEPLRVLLERDAEVTLNLLHEELQRGSILSRNRLVEALMLASKSATPNPYHSSAAAKKTAWLCAYALLDDPGRPEKNEKMREIRYEIKRDAIKKALASECNPVLLPLLLREISNQNSEEGFKNFRLEEVDLASCENVVSLRLQNYATEFISDLYRVGSDGHCLFESWRRYDSDSFRTWFEGRLLHEPSEAQKLLDYFSRDSIELILLAHSYQVSRWVDSGRLLDATRICYDIKAPFSGQGSPFEEILKIYQSDPNRFTRRSEQSIL